MQKDWFQFLYLLLCYILSVRLVIRKKVIQQVTATAGIQAVTVLSQQPEMDRPITAVRRKIQPEQAVQIKNTTGTSNIKKNNTGTSSSKKNNPYNSYDDGYDDIYMDDDYDYDRYYKDSDYADGVDDAMDDLDEDW